ncbi:DUF2975 domain-containing protein [Psychroserpens sp. XS_ASV72]|uniref:DUF2975 domain-containing protein n=1 Tax=Psychroserpens sp. XS_ASV72 TaxID=3241293 RepID=UPI0035176AA3
MKSSGIFKIIHVISWIIFIGFSIKAGALLISYLVSVFVNESASSHLYLGLDLMNIYNLSLFHYSGVVLLYILTAVLKAYLFYLLIKVFQKIDFNNPFSLTIANMITKISYVSLAIGLIAMVALGYTTWLSKQVFFVSSWNASGFLFMAGVIFIVAFLFKRAVEIQTENELTI